MTTFSLHKLQIKVITYIFSMFNTSYLRVVIFFLNWKRIFLIANGNILNNLIYLQRTFAVGSVKKIFLCEKVALQAVRGVLMQRTALCI